MLANDAYGARGVLYRSLIHVVLARRFHKCVIWGFLAPLGMAVNRVHYGASWKSGYHTPLGSSPRGPTGAMLAVLESILLRAHAIHIIRIIPHYFRFVKNDVFHVKLRLFGAEGAQPFGRALVVVLASITVGASPYPGSIPKF